MVPNKLSGLCTLITHQGRATLEGSQQSAPQSLCKGIMGVDESKSRSKSPSFSCNSLLDK